MNKSTTTTDRIELARELAREILEGVTGLEAGNTELFELLADDDCASEYLPGDSAEAIRANIVNALELASQPVPAISTGRNREDRRRRTEYQRAQLHLLCRVTLALLEPTTESSDAADKLAAIEAILEGAAA
ncbi:hypothetical protein [Malikia spinosa]|uniref:Uncharacterized protein n=1 Tax=Malikia spinosa TaxID=86180 RepID=A0A7C9J7P0_9BURK|nr:hypothetical protein [Malikia spinosa]MYZ53171.1 hypothetical protein [Malikia spinosa]